MARKRKESQNKKINPTFFIFCEGETEVAYINFLKSHYRLPTIQIHTRIKGNDISEKYIDSYKQDKPTHQKDKTFLLYDLDVTGMLAKLRGIANCTILVSNPCIEFWFLLHYKSHVSSIQCSICCREMKNRNNHYKKGIINEKLKRKLESKMTHAVTKAKSLKEYNNPSSTVYRLIEELNTLKK